MDTHTFAQRLRFQMKTTAWLDLGLSILALVLLALIVIELAVALPARWAARVAAAQVAIWVVFVAAFAFELAVAPDRKRYLRAHWLVALSLLIPALRIFRVANALRVLRAGRALRALQLARVSTALRGGIRSLRDLVRASQFVYLVLLSVVLTATMAVAVLSFERTSDEANIRNLGDALWWSATTLTTVNSPLEPVTLEGRVLALGLRVFGLAVIGYLTARIAVYLLGSRAAEPASDAGVEAEVRRLRGEVERLTALLARDRARDEA